MVQKAEEQHLHADVEVPAHKIWRQRRTTSLEMKQINDCLNLERAKLVSTSVRLVGDDFCVVARQKQMQAGCEPSVWKSLVCEM